MNKRLWGGLAVALAASAAICLAPVNAQADEFAPIPVDAAHFPDPAFMEYVDCYCDTSQDGLLSAEEIAAVTSMDCENQKSDYLDEGKQLASLKGIEYFTALTKLNCMDNAIEELDLSKNTELVTLDCSVNQIKSLDLSKNTKLKFLYADNNKLTSLNVSGVTTLKRLNCYINELTELDVSDSTAYLELECWNNKLTQLKLPATTCWVSCNNNQLSSLDLSNLKDLEVLDCSSNKISQLNISGCTRLHEMQCNDNRLSQLNLSGCASLYRLDCSNNQLTSLDLSLCNTSVTLTCDNNAYTIDVGSGRTFELDTLPGNFDAAKASGWTGGTADNGTLTVDDSVSSVTYTYDCGRDQSATFTLNAGYAVSFDTDGGSKVDSQTVKVGEKASRPASDPAWIGHVFGGWYADAARTKIYDFENASVNGPTTVYAKWIEDTEAPVIAGIEDGKVYCAAQKATVTDEHLETVTVNGVAIEPEKDGSITLSPAKGEQVVVATDKAGNTTTAAVTVNDGHTWKAKWSHDADKHWHECSACGVESEHDAHSGGTATCSKKAACEACGEEYGEVDADKHENVETLAGKAATCTDDGLTEGSKCTDCGKILVEQQILPANGHKGGTATCSKKAVCDTCSEEYGNLDPDNHESLEHIASKAATIDAEGNIEYWRCTGCGKLFSDEAGTKEIKQADTVIAKKSDEKKDEGKGNDGESESSGNEKKPGNGAPSPSVTEKTVTSVTIENKASSAALAATGDNAPAAIAIMLVSSLMALGAALLHKRQNA